MPAGELSEAVGRGWRAGGDWLVIGEMLDVRHAMADSYLRFRSLASAFMTIQSRSPRTNRLSLAGSVWRVAATGGQRLGGGADAAAGGGWLDLADQAQHLVDSGLAEGFWPDRGTAGQEFVEDGAEGVDIGAGVEIESVEHGLLKRTCRRECRRRFRRR